MLQELTAEITTKLKTTPIEEWMSNFEYYAFNRIHFSGVFSRLRLFLTNSQCKEKLVSFSCSISGRSNGNKHQEKKNKTKNANICCIALALSAMSWSSVWISGNELLFFSLIKLRLRVCRFHPITEYWPLEHRCLCATDEACKLGSILSIICMHAQWRSQWNR